MLSACNSANNKTLLANFTGGVNAPNAYETYKHTGLKIPDINKGILKPNVKNNYLLQLNEIQQKVVQAILLDQSQNMQDNLEPEKIVYLNKKNLDPNSQDNSLINENSTQEDEILFDDLTLFSNKVRRPTARAQRAFNVRLDTTKFTTTASILDEINTTEISNRNFINNFANYILYDEDTKSYTKDLLNLHITTNTANRLKFFRLLDLESQPIDNKKNKYVLYNMGLLKVTPTEYILDVQSEKARLQKLTATNQKITGLNAPMYKIGNAKTTFIGEYMGKIGIQTATGKELRHRNHHIKHEHKFRYKKK